MSARLHHTAFAKDTNAFHRTHREPAALTIDPQGVICDCNESAAMLFGFHRDELIFRDVSQLLPQTEGVEWIQKGQPNHHLSYLSHIGHRFAAVTRDGKEFASRLFLNDLSNSKVTRLLLIIRSSEHG